MKLFFFLISISFVNHSNAQLFYNINVGSAYFMNLSNLNVHEAAINENIENIDKKMKVSNFSTGFGFQIGFKKDALRLYSGWDFKSRTFNLKDVNENELDWRLRVRRTTLFGVGITKGKLEYGLGVDAGTFVLKQNSKGISVFNQGELTNNTNGWVSFYEKNYRILGVNFFSSYSINKLISARFSYFLNFSPAKAYFKENNLTKYQYNMSNFDVSLLINFSK